jgi:hypothetical protein
VCGQEEEGNNASELVSLEFVEGMTRSAWEDGGRHTAVSRFVSPPSCSPPFMSFWM